MSTSNRKGWAEAPREALQWRLLTAWTVGLLLPTAMVAMPVWRTLAAALDASPLALAIARRFDMLAMEDLGVMFARVASAIGGAALLATVLAVALSPLLAGMTVAAARAPEPLGFVALAQGAAQWYGRMFRMLLISGLLFGVAAAIGGAAVYLARKWAERAILESQADGASHAAMALMIALFVLAHVTIEAARAQLAADETLRSGWHAWTRGLRLLGRRPLPLLLSYLGPMLLGLSVAALLLLVRMRLTPATVPSLVFGFVVTQLAVASIGWGRAARLFALTSLART
jgi:hypothetical protein